jgi:EAL domain-containing protein (putative c-di-GMP-specific phosphodiesterase class I)/DNA-binding response OmpR family regulator
MTEPTGLKHILVLDDDADFRALLRNYLGKLFDRVEVQEYDPVARGVPGEDFDWSRYDVLILDYYLCISNVTGLDILQANRKNKLFPAAIMLTGAGSEEVAVRAVKAGVYDYLRKEKLDKEQLKRSILNAFEQHKDEQQRLSELTNQSLAFNKALFYQELESKLDRSGKERVLLLIQLDDDQMLEQRLGGILRDNIVRHIARRSFEVFQVGECHPHITRLGDAAVALLIDKPESRKTLDFNMNGLCAHLKKRPYKFDDKKFRFTVSIGVVEIPRSGRSADRLIQQARRAAELATHTEGNSFHFFAAEDEPALSPEPAAEPSAGDPGQASATPASELVIDADLADALDDIVEEAPEPPPVLPSSLEFPQDEAPSEAEPPVAVSPVVPEPPPPSPETATAAPAPPVAAKPPPSPEPEPVPAPQPATPAPAPATPAAPAAPPDLALEPLAPSSTEPATPAQAPEAATPAPRRELTLEPVERAAAPAPGPIPAATPPQAPPPPAVRPAPAAKAPPAPTPSIAPKTPPAPAPRPSAGPTPAGSAPPPAAKAARPAPPATPAAAPAKPGPGPTKPAAAAPTAKPASPAARPAAAPAPAAPPKPAAPAPKPAAPAGKAAPAAPRPASDEIELDEATLSEAARSIRKAFAEKRVVQTFQPVMPLFNEEGVEVPEVYRVRLQLIDRDGTVHTEDFVYAEANTPDFQKFIDRWLLRETIGRVVNNPGSDQVFIIRISEPSLADPGLFNWLRKLLSGLDKQRPGKSIALEMSAPDFTNQQKKAAALITYLGKSQGFRFVMAQVREPDEAKPLSGGGSGIELLKVGTETLQKLKATPAAAGQTGSMFDGLVGKGVQVIAEGVEDATTLTNVISAGAHYAMGNFIGEPTQHIDDSTNVESFEIT